MSRGVPPPSSPIRPNRSCTLLTLVRSLCHSSGVLSPTGLRVLGSHSVGAMGQLKSARWRDEHVLACAGSVASIALLDIRAGGAQSTGNVRTSYLARPQPHTPTRHYHAQRAVGSFD